MAVKRLTPKKAKKMLKEGKPRSRKQKRFLGAVAGGKPPRKKKKT